MPFTAILLIPFPIWSPHDWKRVKFYLETSEMSNNEMSITEVIPLAPTSSSWGRTRSLADALPGPVALVVDALGGASMDQDRSKLN